MPIAIAMTSARHASSIVTGSFWAISVVTGSCARCDSPRLPCSTPFSQYTYWTGSGLSRCIVSRRCAITAGSRSSPARTIAGSPGRSCCSPKISTDATNSVGTICAMRRTRYVSIGVRAPAAGRPARRQPRRALLESQVLHAHEAVGDRAQAGQLARIRPQPVAMVEVDDRPVLEHDRRELAEELLALGDVAGGARALQDVVDFGLAVTGVVERLLASVEAVDVAVGIGTAAPREHVRVELPLVGHVE